MGRLGSFADALASDSAELAGLAGERGNAPASPVLKAVPAPEPEAAADPPAPPVEVAVPPAAPGPEVAVGQVKGEGVAGDHPAETPAKTAPASKKRAPKKTAPAEAPAPAAAPVSDRARWMHLQRKEFRMHPHQADDLKILTMRVNRTGSRDPEERVTDNTLIRLGLALLLEKHRDELRGSNEDELRASLGLPPLPPLEIWE